MSAQGHVEDSFSFIKGLVTEGGFFVHPKNAWKEGFNVTPNVDGSIERRSGLDYEVLPTYHPSAIDASQRDLWAFTVESWNAVGGNGNLDYFVVQAGPIIHFYASATGTVSAQKKSFTLDLNDFGFTGRSGDPGTSIIKATSAHGKLIITNRDCEPILVIYNSDTDTITTQSLVLLMRDFDGIRSPKSSSDELTETQWTDISFWPHALYNLYNQGWTDVKIDAYKAAKSDKLPANSKVWIYGKNTSDDFDVAVLDKQDFGTMVAPKGRAILNAFYQDREAALTNMAGTNTTTTVVSTTTSGSNVNDQYQDWNGGGGAPE
jgi:hypothetical protein